MAADNKVGHSRKSKQTQVAPKVLWWHHNFVTIFRLGRQCMGLMTSELCIFRARSEHFSEHLWFPSPKIKVRTGGHPTKNNLSKEFGCTYQGWFHSQPCHFLFSKMGSLHRDCTAVYESVQNKGNFIPRQRFLSIKSACQRFGGSRNWTQDLSVRSLFCLPLNYHHGSAWLHLSRFKEFFTYLNHFQKSNCNSRPRQWCDDKTRWQRYMVTEEPIRLLARLTDTAKATCVRTSVCHASINQRVTHPRVTHPCVTHQRVRHHCVSASVTKSDSNQNCLFCKQSLKCDDVMICQRLKKLYTVKNV